MATDGRGSINYDVSKPSYAFSTSTTRFDDELMRRGIVSLDQAMIAKGATPQEARRLAELREGSSRQAAAPEEEGGEGSGRAPPLPPPKGIRPSYDDIGERRSEFGDDDDDDELFLERYRRMRLLELKGEAGHRGVLHISRSDWTREVNDASRDGTWVVINLTRGSLSHTSHGNLDTCQAAEGAFTELAESGDFPGVKFVCIPATSADERWSADDIPAILCYRYGRLQGQLVGPGEFGGHNVTRERVEWRLEKLGVLKSALTSDVPIQGEGGLDRRGSTGAAGGEWDVEDKDYDNVD